MTVRLCALALCVGACSLGPSSEEKSEAARVIRAVETLRDAPNENKAGLLEALRKNVVTLQDVAELKHSCVSAYELHVSALERTRKARAGLGDAPLNVAAEALRDLDRAKDELKRAEPLMQKCTQQQGAVRRHYKF